jgi:hypothetical protein
MLRRIAGGLRMVLALSSTPSVRSSFSISLLPSKVTALTLGRSRTTKRSTTPSARRSRSTSMSSKKPEP